MFSGRCVGGSLGIASALLFLILTATAEAAAADPIDDLVAQVSEDAIRAHTTALVGIGPRDTPDRQAAAADYIATQFESYGYEIVRQPVLQSENIIARLSGTVTPDQTFVVGAHFDTVPGAPGADDNGAAVAGLLEIARVLAGQAVAPSFEFIAFAGEELWLSSPGVWGNWIEPVGSAIYADSARDQLRDIIGMFSLEMIAYTCATPGCQVVFPNIPHCLQTNQPPTPNVGNFIAGVGNDRSADLLHTFANASHRYVPDLPFGTAQVAGIGSCMFDSDRSDHFPFWADGYPALMITDTANFRNPNYHKPSDTLDTLDFTFAHRVTRAALATALSFAHLAADAPTPTPTRIPTPFATPTPVPGARVILYAAGDQGTAVIDTADNTLLGTLPSSGLSRLNSSLDGRSLYVLAQQTYGDTAQAALTAIDTLTNTVTNSMSIAGNTFDLAITPDGRFAYVSGTTAPQHGSVVVLDTGTLSVTATILTTSANPGLPGLRGIEITPDGRFAYVIQAGPSDRNDDALVAIDTTTNLIAATVPTGDPFSVSGNTPVRIGITPDGATAYVTNDTSATVSAIDLTQNTLIKNILVHQGPGQVVVSPDGRFAYVGAVGDNAVSKLDVIDTATNKVVATVPFADGTSPDAMAITPDGASVYVAVRIAAFQQRLLIFETATRAFTTSVPADGWSVNYISALQVVAVPTSVIFVPTPQPTLTPTPLPPRCLGDCNHDRSVKINELILGVNILLGNAEIDWCTAGFDDPVTVDQVVSAVNAALNGCP